MVNTGQLLATGAVAFLFALVAHEAAAQAPAIDRDDIGGTVMGPAGPEAGVGVIAETRMRRAGLVRARGRSRTASFTFALSSP